MTRNSMMTVVAGVLGAASVLALASPSSATVRPSAKAPVSGALIAAGESTTQAFGSVATSSPHSLGTVISEDSDLSGTAYSPSGANALVALGTAGLEVISNPLTKPKISRVLDLGSFGGEGGPDYSFYDSGVAIAGTTALVTGDEQGLVQLTESSGSWKVDTRVHSKGLADGGWPQQPGWIAFKLTGAEATTFDGVAISPVRLKSGGYEAVTIDRDFSSGDPGAIAVITGVGTADPKVTAIASSLAFGRIGDGDVGNGGIAFSPVTPTRAVIASPSGVAVLNLANPANPVVQNTTIVGSDDDVEAVAVSPGGNDVAVAEGDTVEVLGGVLQTSTTAPLAEVETFTPASGDDVTDLAYLADGDLVTADGVQLETWTATTTPTAALLGSVALAGSPEAANSLSVRPAEPGPAIEPATLPGPFRVGTKVDDKLTVIGPAGTYMFSVSSGRLPAGLKLVSNAIAGKPTAAGTSKVTISATNQYGGSASNAYVIKVLAKA